ncbi:hypothetical protein BSL78_20521 [Apostichopus japonicus]|uniref:Uncharacterized protein n=1 Tax=Stichopus japonicus TaxID=307972 RepID=A0A2G8K3T7_STIJA|nr:hypothetical protein BSL78_20521 [Apostichopus japonicus]
MDPKLLQVLLFLSVAVSYAEALYKPGNFLIIIISVILPAAVLLGFCGVGLFICKNRKRIPVLRSKFGTHEKIPQSSGKPGSAPPMMPPPQAQPQTPPSAPSAPSGDDITPLKSPE